VPMAKRWQQPATWSVGHRVGGGTPRGVGRMGPSWFGGSGEDGAHRKQRLHDGGIRSVWTCRQRLSTMARTAGSGSWEHQGDGAILEEVAAGPEVVGGGLSAVRSSLQRTKHDMAWQ
jgi:hypothetical protein